MAARTSRKVQRPKTPRQSARAKSANSAAESRLTTLSDHSETGGKCLLIHGDTGSGKTVLAIKEGPRPALVLDCDTGLDSVIGTKASEKVDIWGPAGDELELTWEDMDEFRNYVLAGDWRHPYKLILVDNITAGQKPVVVSSIDEAMARLDEDKRAARDPDIPSQQDWGKIYRRLDRWIRDIKSAKRRGVHVIFTAGTKEWMDEVEGYTRMMPNIEGQERNQISTHMDAVGWLESDEDGRRLHLAPSGAYVTKLRLPIARHGYVPEAIEDPDFNSMMEAVIGLEKKEAKRKTTTRKKTTKTTRSTK